ncbi:general odorant-binding protein 83a-like [Armigeres subalbatus]|uniref:general odorant-binding protein 83a-like n=1 Tax=Armigeres subalbatus TaxID=124917 RepID=UPI002ED125AB
MCRRLVLVCFMLLWSNNAKASQNLTALRGADYPPMYLVSLVKAALDKCHEQIHIDDAVIQQFRDDGDFEGTEQLGCYLHCVFREKGYWIPEKREIDIMKILDIVPKDFEQAALKMGLRCMKVKGDDDCARSLWYHSCWKKNDPAHYYLI